MSQLNKLAISLFIIKLLAVSCAVRIPFSKRQQVQIPEGKWYLQGNRYFSWVSDFKVNWEDAKNACLKQGATLLIDNDPEVKEVLISWGHMVWMGGKQNDDDDRLYWINGSPVNNDPKNWAYQQPAKNANKRCLTGDNNGLWHLQSCEAKYEYICQFMPDIDDCAGGPCKNGGTCTDGVHQFTCKCAPEWKGQTCEKKKEINDKCASGPCKNGGTCKGGVNQFNCECAPGWKGVTCEEALRIMEFKMDHGGATSDYSSSYNAQKAFEDSTYWHPASSASLPQTVYNKFLFKVHVTKFQLEGGKKKKVFPKKFIFFGSNGEDCKDQVKWDLQVSYEDPDYDSQNTFEAEVENPNIFRCYGIQVKETDDGVEAAIERIRMYGTGFAPLELNNGGASSTWSSSYKVDKAFRDDGYWYPKKSQSLPHTIFNKFASKVQVTKFVLKIGKGDSDYCARNFIFFGSNDDNCLDQEKWELQVSFVNPDYDSDLIFQKEVENPNMFSCYGFLIKETDNGMYVALKRIQMYGTA